MKNKIMLQSVVAFFSILVFVSFYSPSVYADTGDFYEKYEDTIKEEVKIEQYRELIEKYDYDTNEFECGTFEVNCFFQGTYFKMAIGTVKAIYGGIENLVVTPANIVGNDTFREYKNGLGALSKTILAIFLMWQVIKMVSVRFADADDGMIALNDKLVMVFVAGILLGIYDQFFVYVLKFQQFLTEAILSEPLKMEKVALIIFTNGSGYGFIVAFIISVAVMIFALAYMYRFVLFGLLYIVGVIAIPTALNEEYNYFSIWLKTLINNGVTLFLQAICFTLGFEALINNNAFNKGISFTVALAFFILALTIPGMLGNLGASTGSGRAIGTIVKYAARRR